MLDVIGAGRIGTMLADRGRARGVDVRLLDRDAPRRPLAGRSDPIVVATRNDALADVIDGIPASRHVDLVFVQNGMLGPFLAAQGLADATRGLLFVAVPTKGARAQPGAPSPFTGPRADDVVAAFRALDLPAEAVARTDFAAVELEKLLWNGVYGLLGSVTGDPVGTIARDRADEVRALVDELAPVGARALGIPTPDLDALTASLQAYSRSIPDFPARMKEWAWRNGALVDAAAAQGVELPVHARLVRWAR